MTRTQIQLDLDEMKKLGRVARARSCSVAAVVREGIRLSLVAHEQQDLRERASKLVGKYRGPADLASNHDAHLDQGW